MCQRLAVVVVSLLLPGVCLAGIGGLDIPYRQGRLQVDADLDDWREALRLEWQEPAVPEPQRNRAVAWLVWDLDYLWLAVEVTDHEVFAPPPEAGATTMYQWDSIELYLDTDGSGGDRMDPFDFQLIFSCDGRVVVLQGDPIVAEVDSFLTPKLPRPTIDVRLAASRQPNGYQIEAAVPLSALGLAEVEAGARLGIDLTFNDWLDDHPIIPEHRMSLENLDMLRREVDPAELTVDDPAGIGYEAGRQLLHQLYRPWALSATWDFGCPQLWQQVTLVGGPALSERLVRRIGARGVVFASLILTVCLTGLALAGARRRHRRCVRELLDRLAALEARQALAVSDQSAHADLAVTDQPEETPSSTDGLILRQLIEQGAGTSQPAPDLPASLAERAIAIIQDRLGESLTVSQLAQELCVSQRSLERELSQTLQCSPRLLILAVRMQRAHELLRSGRLRVNEVAERVGFATPSHFSRRFREYYRVPPSHIVPNERLSSTDLQ